MGCDIHAFIEYSEASQIWYTFAKLHLSRDYVIFAKMAGVRNETGVTPVAPLRDIPDDAGWTIQFDYFDEGRRSKVKKQDWHSPSWLTLEEFAKAINGEDAWPDYTACLACMRSFVQSGYNARIVFWFDN